MISTLEQLYPLLQVDLPNIKTPLLQLTLQQVTRQWCRDTETWVDRISMPLINAIGAYNTAYNAAIAAGKSVSAAIILGKEAENNALVYDLMSNYNAEIIRPLAVWTTGNDTDTKLDITGYSFNPGTGALTLLSKPDADTVQAWVTLTAYIQGSKVSHGKHNYECSIAHSADVFATDLTAGKWVQLPDGLIVDLVIMPRLYTVEIAAHFMEKWAEAIVAKTKVDLMVMKDKDWSSPDRVPYFLTEYNKYLSLALRERFSENKSAGIRFLTRPWIG